MSTLTKMIKALQAASGMACDLQYENDVLRKRLREVWFIVPKAVKDELEPEARKQFEDAMRIEVPK
jgi:hypothetical protein